MRRNRFLTLTIGILIGILVGGLLTLQGQEPSSISDAVFNTRQAEECNVNPQIESNLACTIAEELMKSRDDAFIAFFETTETANDPRGNASRREMLEIIRDLHVATVLRAGRNFDVAGQPAEQFFKNSPAIQDGGGLCIGGVGSEGIMHHSFIIIDREVVITGSPSWNGSSFEDNAENFVIIHDERLAKQYLEEMERIWDCDPPLDIIGIDGNG